MAHGLFGKFEFLEAQISLAECIYAVELLASCAGEQFKLFLDFSASTVPKLHRFEGPETESLAGLYT